MIGNLGLGVTYNRSRADTPAELTATYEAQFMNIVEALSSTDPETVTDLRRTEDVIHIQAVYMIPITRKFNVGVFGGPSYFKCKRDVLNDWTGEVVDTNNDFISDAIDIDYPRPEFFQQESASTWGWNAAADADYFFTDHIGIGFMTRYSYATMDYENPIDRAEIAAGDAEQVLQQVVPMDMGGWQFVGGVRFRF